MPNDDRSRNTSETRSEGPVSNNAGNFANDRERAREAGRKGGLNSRGRRNRSDSDSSRQSR